MIPCEFPGEVMRSPDGDVAKLLGTKENQQLLDDDVSDCDGASAGLRSDDHQQMQKKDGRLTHRYIVADRQILRNVQEFAFR